jgi:hypothetical protein
MTDAQPPVMPGPTPQQPTTRADKRREGIVSLVRSDAQQHWDSGYTHYLLTIDGQENTAYLIQWVESIGWRLEHAGWIWAEKGWVGYGGFGVLNSGVIGNFLFGRPGGASSLAKTTVGSPSTRPDL